MSDWQNHPQDPPRPFVPEDGIIGNSPLNPHHPSSQAYRGQPQEPKPPKKHTVRNIVLGVVVGIFLVIGGCTALVGGALSSVDTKAPVDVTSQAGTPVDNSTTPDPVVTPTNEPSVQPRATHKPQPQRTVPVAKDFTLSVKTLSKKCFGSAGCNVTYRILVAYDGPALDSSKSYEVTYQVRGGEDGPEINTLTVEDGQSTVQDEEFLSTKSSKSKVTAVATSVDES